MGRRTQAAEEARAGRAQQVVDGMEARRIAAYVSTSQFLRSLCGTVEGAARRADALARLEVALRRAPLGR